MSVSDLRKGWCPGVLRPMPAGDGLLVRVKVPGAALSAGQAAAIADLATRYGNGAIDLTQRANLQLRGVQDGTLASLTVVLEACELVDDEKTADATGDVIVSPLAGLDLACKDGRALASELVRQLACDPRLDCLPAKFGVAIDGGGLWPLGLAGADLLLSAHGAGGGWRVGLGGADVFSHPVAEDRAAAVLTELAAFFCEHARPDERRMRALVSRLSAAEIFAAVGLSVGAVLPVPATAALPGLIELPPKTVLAIGLPFGHIDAAALAALAAAAPECEFRLTPWRLLCAVCPDGTVAEAVATAARRYDLILSPDDARLGIDACTGAPGCTNASVRTRHDAAELARLLRGRPNLRGTIHVSGCQKGCAHRGAAPLTLVGRNGAYDLVLNGAPADPPVRTGIRPAELYDALSSRLP